MTIYDSVDSTGGYVESTAAGLTIGGFGTGLQPATLGIAPAPTAALAGISVNRVGITVATGTSPLGITSTTVCTNLNADLLDGSHASAFAPSSGANYSNWDAAYSAALTLGTIATKNTGTSASVEVLDGGGSPIDLQFTDGIFQGVA